MTDPGGAASPRTLGELVRRDRGSTQAIDAAKAAGVSRSFWSDVEHNRRVPSRLVAAKMCGVLVGNWNEWLIAWSRGRLDGAFDDLRAAIEAEAAQEAPAPEGPPTILEATDGPRVRCSKCGSELLGRGWLEHHDDGSHSFYPAEARPPEGRDTDPELFGHLAEAPADGLPEWEDEWPQPVPALDWEAIVGVKPYLAMPDGTPCWCESADAPHEGWVHAPFCLDKRVVAWLAVRRLSAGGATKP